MPIPRSSVTTPIGSPQLRKTSWGKSRYRGGGMTCEHMTETLGERVAVLDPWMVDIVKRNEEPQKSEIRMSSLPICERRISYSRYLPADHDGHFLQQNVQSLMWTSIGDVLHEIMQNEIARYGVLWGHWLCKHCDKRVNFDFGPLTCCEHQMHYEELAVKDEVTGLTGHVDGVLRLLDENGDVIWCILEIKTKSAGKLVKLDAPVPKHHQYQAAGYARLVEQNFDVPISKVLYMYISRDCPWQFTIEFSTKDGEFSTVFRHGGAYAQPLMRIFLRDPDFSRIDPELVRIGQIKKRLNVMTEPAGPESRLCKGPTDDLFCPYKTICFDE